MGVFGSLAGSSVLFRVPARQGPFRRLVLSTSRPDEGLAVAVDTRGHVLPGLEGWPSPPAPGGQGGYRRRAGGRGDPGGVPGGRHDRRGGRGGRQPRWSSAGWRGERGAGSGAAGARAPGDPGGDLHARPPGSSAPRAWAASWPASWWSFSASAAAVGAAAPRPAAGPGDRCCLQLYFRLFPRTFLGRRLILRREPLAGRPSPQEAAELSGREGVSLTVLRPAGIAEIDGRRFRRGDRRGVHGAGPPVRVIRVEGNRVVVRALPPR